MTDYPFDRVDIRSLTGEQMYKVLSDWINSHAMSGISSRGFSKELNASHRTLQESFISLVWAILLQYGKDHQEEFSFDARNEDAVKLCRKLVALVEKEELLNYLRFI
jgi:hypothetical protein